MNRNTFNHRFGCLIFTSFGEIVSCFDSNLTACCDFLKPNEAYGFEKSKFGIEINDIMKI